ncbi:hypothetical protein NP493_469g03003 [Ridgeia piscesae]|uniref:Uncharacterized protein n=1 Tax=Ridgeia piscesae TaxID=27915 RepID=A0AAD9NRA4_RIDPI|nr:hypothetical protein NP493_469g03003 [Ridgeia piscesae]
MCVVTRDRPGDLPQRPTRPWSLTADRLHTTGSTHLPELSSRAVGRSVVLPRSEMASMLGLFALLPDAKRCGRRQKTRLPSKSRDVAPLAELEAAVNYVVAIDRMAENMRVCSTLAELANVGSTHHGLAGCGSVSSTLSFSSGVTSRRSSATTSRTNSTRSVSTTSNVRCVSRSSSVRSVSRTNSVLSSRTASNSVSLRSDGRSSAASDVNKGSKVCKVAPTVDKERAKERANFNRHPETRTVLKVHEPIAPAVHVVN